MLPLCNPYVTPELRARPARTRAGKTRGEGSATLGVEEPGGSIKRTKSLLLCWLQRLAAERQAAKERKEKEKQAESKRVRLEKVHSAITSMFDRN
eukprot:7994769-Pyramimonas_sp.AAC.3